MGNITLDGSSLVIHETCSLFMLSSISYVSPMTKLNILQHTRVYREISKATVVRFYLVKDFEVMLVESL